MALLALFAVQSANSEVWERYFDPTVLLALCWLTALGIDRTRPHSAGRAALGALLAQPADTLRAGLVDGAWYVASPWPVVSIWRAHQPDAAIALSSIDLGTPEAAVVTVQDHRVVVLDLDPSTAVFLAACDATPSLQAALTQTMTAQADFDLTACLAGLYRAGLLALSTHPAPQGSILGDTP